jgi:uncharacterized protein HemY
VASGSKNEGACQKTLGVARYRNGDWEGALAALNRSMELGAGGDGYDWLFLAMTHWQLGRLDEARAWYENAAGWMEQHSPHNKDLQHFRTEAAALLGISNAQDERAPNTGVR